jgi:hypothetical protein
MLVRWNLSGWTKPKIAREWRVSPSAVTNALVQTAELVGVPLRKGTPGRPPPD